jgi:hypothetical protein
VPDDHQSDDAPTSASTPPSLFTRLITTPGTVYSRYSSLVKANREPFRLVENIISSVGYTLPSRFDDDEIGVELSCAFASVLSLVNDSICYGWGDGTGMTVGPQSSATDDASLSSLPPSSQSTRRAQVCLRAVIAAIECTELAFEKWAGGAGIGGGVNQNGVAHRLTIVTRLETIKALSRVFLLLLALSPSSATTKNKLSGLLQHGGALSPGERCCTPEREDDMKLRANGWNERKKNDVPHVGKRSGKVLMLPKPTPLNIANSEEATAPISGETTNYNLVAGELLHILRPLCGVKLQKACGSGSMIPWIMGLLMDVLSHKLSIKGLTENQSETGEKKKKDDGKLILVGPTAVELKRRKMRWMLYLLRQPIWSLLTKSKQGGGGGGLEAAANKVPTLLGGYFLRYALRWLFYLQKHHFLLEGGILS